MIVAYYVICNLISCNIISIGEGGCRGKHDSKILFIPYTYIYEIVVWEIANIIYEG